MDVDVDPREIKVARIRLGLTQAEVAHLAGIHQQYVSAVELGRGKPEHTQAVLNALGLLKA